MCAKAKPACVCCWDCAQEVCDGALAVLEGQGNAGQVGFEGERRCGPSDCTAAVTQCPTELIFYTLNRKKTSGSEGCLLEESRNVFLTKWAQCSAAKSYCPSLRGVVS